MRLKPERLRSSVAKKGKRSISAKAQLAASEATEMQLLEMYHSEAARTRQRMYPLVDIVTPQPQAFFAYLQMPKTKKPAQNKRIARRRPGSKA